LYVSAGQTSEGILDDPIRSGRIDQCSALEQINMKKRKRPTGTDVRMYDRLRDALQMDKQLTFWTKSREITLVKGYHIT
jgi:hypothetical protein